jgi:hypothetical protein
MVVNCKRGKGKIWNAGSCEWVAGLLERDDVTMSVTRNASNKFSS